MTGYGSSNGVMGNAGSDAFGVESVIIGAGINNTAADQNPNHVYLDEIRVGETWADVTSAMTVPEPATISILCIGAVVGLLARRRRAA